MSDFKNAVRALRKSPGFSIVAVLTIAVGIGANTALFSVYDRLVLNPVTIPAPSSLVAIWVNNPQLNFNAPAVSWPRYEEIRSQNRSFASVGISAFDNFTLTGNGDPEQLNGQRVSATFFPTLGIMPLVGRNFTTDEDQANGPSVCIISHELWQTRFGGRATLVGEAITLNGQPWQVVGIMPPRLTAPFGQVQVFAPRVFEVGGLTPIQVQNGAGYAQPIARLRPGVSQQQAQSELAGAGRPTRSRRRAAAGRDRPRARTRRRHGCGAADSHIALQRPAARSARLRWRRRAVRRRCYARVFDPVDARRANRSAPRIAFRLAISVLTKTRRKRGRTRSPFWILSSCSSVLFRVFVILEFPDYSCLPNAEKCLVSRIDT